jgi:hypothetical protein
VGGADPGPAAGAQPGAPAPCSRFLRHRAEVDLIGRPRRTSRAPTAIWPMIMSWPGMRTSPTQDTGLPRSRQRQQIGPPDQTVPSRPCRRGVGSHGRRCPERRVATRSQRGGGRGNLAVARSARPHHDPARTAIAVGVKAGPAGGRQGRPRIRTVQPAARQ